MENFESHFEKVKAIILKLRRHYFVKLWDYDDWLQEGRIVFLKLLQDNPELVKDEMKLYTYFKTKFSNYTKDVIRHQESLKRKFNRLPYEEISELHHCIAQPMFMEVADYLAYQDRMKAVGEALGDDAKEKLNKVIRGERFDGKRSFLREIKPFFTDFSDIS